MASINNDVEFKSFREVMDEFMGKTDEATWKLMVQYTMYNGFNIQAVQQKVLTKVNSASSKDRPDVMRYLQTLMLVGLMRGTNINKILKKSDPNLIENLNAGIKFFEIYVKGPKEASADHTVAYDEITIPRLVIIGTPWIYGFPSSAFTPARFDIPRMVPQLQHCSGASMVPRTKEGGFQMACCAAWSLMFAAQVKASMNQWQEFFGYSKNSTVLDDKERANGFQLHSLDLASTAKLSKKEHDRWTSIWAEYGGNIRLVLSPEELAGFFAVTSFT